QPLTQFVMDLHGYALTFFFKHLVQMRGEVPHLGLCPDKVLFLPDLFDHVDLELPDLETLQELCGIDPFDIISPETTEEKHRGSEDAVNNKGLKGHVIELREKDLLITHVLKIPE